MFIVFNKFKYLSKLIKSNFKMSTLSNDEIQRYSRQIILKEIGIQGQKKLKSSSVLIVGCGGLGCPSSMYLAAAGVGKIGLLDYDKVELNNLHRQVLHNEKKIGMQKTESIEENLKKLNSNIEFELIKEKINSKNCIEIVKNYDIVIDASDNAPTRYLVNDACVINNKTLVSGAALKFDGQLIVYNYLNKTACYRCLYPTPPPANSISNCSEGGVLGVVPGIIGSIQALETIKILVGLQPSYAGTLLLFDGLEGTFRKFKIRSKNQNCAICSSKATINPKEFDYEKFCGSVSCDTTQKLKVLHELERINVAEYKQVLDSSKPHVLIDVRPENEFNIVKLSNAKNIPLAKLRTKQGLDEFFEYVNFKSKLNLNVNEEFEIFCICKKGNASQIAVRFLKDNIFDDYNLIIRDIEGGLEQYAKQIDSSLPVY